MILGAYRRCARQVYGLDIKKVTSMSNDMLNVPRSCFTLMTRNKSDHIPAPPVAPPAIDSVPEVLNALGEPTLSSLGLASWYPSGLVQYGLENLHVGLNLPWWAAIVVGTVTLRMLTMPLIIYNQRYSVTFQNHAPELKILQEKFERAKRSNNSVELTRAATNLHLFVKENDIKPIRNFLSPVIQTPIFISVFVGIRQMANLPVESMTNGGIMWFTDLTTADPFFILPVVTVATFALTAELGMESIKAGSASPKLKWFMRAIPVCALPFTLNFPSSILLYWLTSNGVSLAQALVLKSKAVRKIFKIPQVKISPEKHVVSEKIGFIQSFKNNFKKSRTAATVEERMRTEAVKFKEAGMGAIPKTYSYDPTKK